FVQSPLTPPKHQPVVAFPQQSESSPVVQLLPQSKGHFSNPNFMGEMIVESNQEQSENGPLDHILMTEEELDRHPHQEALISVQAPPSEAAYDLKRPHQRAPIRRFKSNPVEPSLCHPIESKELAQHRRKNPVISHKKSKMR